MTAAEGGTVTAAEGATVTAAVGVATDVETLIEFDDKVDNRNDIDSASSDSPLGRNVGSRDGAPVGSFVMGARGDGCIVGCVTRDDNPLSSDCCKPLNNENPADEEKLIDKLSKSEPCDTTIEASDSETEPWSPVLSPWNPGPDPAASDSDSAGEFGGGDT